MQKVTQQLIELNCTIQFVSIHFCSHYNRWDGCIKMRPVSGENICEQKITFILFKSFLSGLFFVFELCKQKQNICAKKLVCTTYSELICEWLRLKMKSKT